MVKLLIGLNHKEFQVLIWKFIIEPNGCKIKTFGRPLIIGNKCKMNAWCTWDLHIISCIFEKLGLFFKVTFPSKPKFYQMYLRQNVSKLTY